MYAEYQRLIWIWVSSNRIESLGEEQFANSFPFLLFLFLFPFSSSQVQASHVLRFTKTSSIRKGVALRSRRRSFARIFLRSVLHRTFIPSQPQIVVCRALLCAPRHTPNAAFFQSVAGNFSSSNFSSFFSGSSPSLIQNRSARVDKRSLECSLASFNADFQSSGDTASNRYDKLQFYNLMFHVEIIYCI